MGLNQRFLQCPSLATLRALWFAKLTQINRFGYDSLLEIGNRGIQHGKCPRRDWFDVHQLLWCEQDRSIRLLLNLIVLMLRAAEHDALLLIELRFVGPRWNCGDCPFRAGSKSLGWHV